MKRGSRKGLNVAVFVFALMVMVGSVNANVIINGDLPSDQTSYRIEAYDHVQTNYCDLNPDNAGDHLLAYADGVYGNPNMSDNADYSLDLGSYSGTVYFYVCTGISPSNIVLKFTENVNDGDTLHIDVGKVSGSSLHADLGGSKVIVCDELNGNALSSESKTESTVGGGSNPGSSSYAQYYYIDGSQQNNDIYVLLDSDATPSCTWDSSILTAKRIMMNTSIDNYGVQVTFSPANKATGDLHSEFNNGGGTVHRIEVEGDNGRNAGIAYTQGDCYDDAEDDYTLYYYNPTSGDLTLRLYSSAANPTIISSVNNGFSSQDAVIKIHGKVPVDIDRVEIVDNNNIVYSSSPSSSGDYTLYVKDNFNGVLKFLKNGNVVFTKSISVPDTSDTSCGGDIEVDLAKYYGDTHSDLHVGYTIKVFSDASFTNELSDQSYEGNPDDTSGEYEVYFEVPAPNTQTYILIDGNQDTEMFGKTVNAGDSIELNIYKKIYGKLPSSVNDLETDSNSDSTPWNSFKDIRFGNGNPDANVNYVLYSVYANSSSFDVYVYDSSSNLVLVRGGKSFGSADDLEFDVSRVYGEIDGSFIGANATGRIEVYDDRGDANVLDDNRDKETDATGTGGNDEYSVYFESTPSLLGDGKIDVKFAPDSVADGITWIIEIAPATGSWEGKGKQLDLTKVFNGNVQNDVKYVSVSCENEDKVIVEVDSSSTPASYKGYMYDFSCTHNIYYNANTSAKRVVSRDSGYSDINSLVTNHGVFNVGKVKGEAHSDLETGNDIIRVCSSLSCSSYLSSEDVNPSDNSGDDYVQYFEADSSNPTGTLYYLEVEMNNSNNAFITHGNAFQLAADYSKTVDLLVEKKGKVREEVAKVGVDRDEDGTDDEVSEVIVTSDGREYKLFTQTDNSVDVNYYDSSSTKLLKIDEDFSMASMYNNDISKVGGKVPSDIDIVEVEKSGYEDGACGGSLYSQVTPSGGNYALYYEDVASTSYDILFCKGGNVVLKWSFTAVGGGGNAITINVGKIYGNIESSFYDRSNGEIKVFNHKGGTQLSTTFSLGDGTPDNYDVYFIQNDSSSSLEVEKVNLYFKDASGLESWRFNLNNGGSAIKGGDAINVDFTHKVEGTVSDSLSHINVEDKSGLYESVDSVLVEAEVSHLPGSCDNYAMYLDSQTANGKWFLDAYDTNGVFVFGKEQGTDSGSVQGELDIAKLTGSIESSFVDADNASHVGDTPSVDIYTGWNDNSPSSPLNSHSFITNGGSSDSYVVYVDTTTSTASDVHIRFIDKDGYTSWNLKTFSITAKACSFGTYDASVKVQGDTPLTKADRIFVDDYSNGGTTHLAVAIPKGDNEGDDGTYHLYGHDWQRTSSSYSIDFIVTLNGASGTKVLQRKADNNAQLTSQSFDVIKLYGDIEGSYYDGSNNAPVRVYKDYSTSSGTGSGLLSSYNENDSIVTNGGSYDSYVVYFEYDGDNNVDVRFTPSEKTAGTADYVSWRLNVDKTPSDDTDNTPLNAGDIVQMNLNRYVKGYAANTVDYVQIYPNNGGSSRMLSAIYTTTDSTSYKIWFDNVSSNASVRWWMNVFAKYDGSIQEKVLVRYKGNTGDSSYDAISNGEEFDVARVIGSRHSNLDNSEDELYVYTADSNNKPHEVGQLRSDDQSGRWFKDAGNYYVYFEQLHTSNENYILEINDSESASSNIYYLSYDRVTDDNDGNVGDTIQQNLNALKTGTITDECSNDRISDVLITQKDSSSTTILSTTEAYDGDNHQYDGTYRFYTAFGTYDIYYNGTGFLNYIKDDESLAVGDNVNDISMKYVAKVLLLQEYPNASNAPPLPGADVYIINVDNQHEQLQTCSDSNGYYYFTVDPNTWQKVDFRAEKPFFTTVFDDNGGGHFALSDDPNAQVYEVMWLDTDKNAVSLKFEDLRGGEYIRGNVNIKVLEMTKFNSTLYEDDIENDNWRGWVTTGMWHITSRRSHSGQHAWWYGRESTGNYDNGTKNSGYLVTPQIDLTGMKNASLSFWSWEDTEISHGGLLDKDVLSVEITIDDGNTWNTLWTNYNKNTTSEEGSWYERSLDLSSYVGNRIKVRFVFDTIDQVGNYFEGWYIDDLNIITDEGVFDNVSLYYASYDNLIMSDDWQIIGVDTNGSNGWSFNVDTTQISDGSYYIKAAGIENHYGIVDEEVVVPVYIDNTPPTLNTTNVVNGKGTSHNLFKNGDEILLQLNANAESGLNINSNFSNVDSNYVRGDENVDDVGGELYNVGYMLSLNNQRSDGTYNIPVNVCDSAGNCVSGSAFVELDNTAPTVQITQPQENDVLSGTYTFSFTVQDSNVDVNSIYISFDNGKIWNTPTCNLAGNTATCTYNLDTTSLADGVTYNARVKSEDVVGNEGESNVLFIVDNEAPESVEIIYPYYNQYLTSTTTIEAVVSDAVSSVASVKFQYYDGSSWNDINTDTSAPWTASFDACSHTNAVKLRAIATDDESNTLTSAEVPILVDCTAPSGTLNVPSNVVKGWQTISLSTSDGDIKSVQFEIKQGTEWYSLCYDELSPYECRFNTEMLSDGQHDVKAVIKDLAGHSTEETATINIDNTAPTVQITQPQENEFVKGQIEIKFTVSDDHINYNKMYISTNGGQSWSWVDSCYSSSCTVQWDTTGAEDGVPYLLIVKVEDEAGNVGYSPKIIVVPDNSGADSAVVVRPLNGQVVSGSMVMEAIVSDAVSGIDKVEFYVDGNKVDEDTSPSFGWKRTLDTTTLSDGSHTLKVKVYDAKGNVRTSNEVDFIVDNGAPQVSLQQPTTLENLKPGSDVKVVFSCSEANAEAYRMQLVQNGAVIAEREVNEENMLSPCTSNGTITDYLYVPSYAADGIYDIVVRVYDKVNHLASVTKSGVVRVDSVAPSTQLSTSPTTSNSAGWFKSDVTVTLIAQDTGSGVSKINYSVDGSQYYQYVSSFILGEGKHILIYYAVDNAGNKEGVHVASINIDTSPSPTDIISPTSDNSNSPLYYKPGEEIRITWSTPLDNLSGVSTYTFYLEKNGAVYSSSSGHTDNKYIISNVLPEGEYVAGVKAEDRAGNVASSYGSRFTFVIDGTSPTVQIVDTPSSSNSRTFTVKVEASDNYGVDECRMDVHDVAFDDMAYVMTRTSTGHYERTLTVPADGNYNVYVRCKDMAGNVNNNAVIISVSVRSKAPAVTSSAPSQGYKNNPSNAEITITTDVASVCKWDFKDVDYDHMSYMMTGTGTTHTISSSTISNWQDGLYQIYYRCKDTLGNVMESSGLIQYVLDREEPSLPSPILPAYNAYVNSGDVELHWTPAEDNIAGIKQYKVEIATDPGFTQNEQEITVNSTSYTLHNLVDGTYYWRVKAEDRAGNEGGYSEIMKFTVDTQAPTINNCDINDTTISYYVLNPRKFAKVSCNGAGATNEKIEIYTSTGVLIHTFNMTNGEGIIDASAIGVDGTYVVKVVWTDRAGNEVEYELAYKLNVDGTPPETIVALDKTATGFVSITNVRAVLRDLGSGIATAEVHVGPEAARSDITKRCSDANMYDADGSFINTNTYTLSPVDGAFDSGLEEVVASINGDLSGYCLFVHAKDKAGNWEQTKAAYITSDGHLVFVKDVKEKSEVSASTTTPLVGRVIAIATESSTWVYAGLAALFVLFSFVLFKFRGYLSGFVGAFRRE